MASLLPFNPAVVTGVAARVEGLLALVVFAAMALLPLAGILGRLGVVGMIAGSSVIVQHLTLVITFLGAMLAARYNRLLALSLVTLFPAWFQARSRVITGAIGVAVMAGLCGASVNFVRIEREAGDMMALGIPAWVIIAVMPAGFAVIAAWMIWHTANHWRGRLLAALGLGLPLVLAFLPDLPGPGFRAVSVAALLLATVLGLPIFATLGGLALVLFWCDFVPIAAVSVATYQLSASPMLPAIPLFTLAGYILAEGGASQRLVRVFQALIGWMPGGLAIVTVVIFAFFTSFTGASGVAILSLGGLLLPVLVKSGYPERFSIGLVTSSGSIGLLFPPSLAVILYGVYSQTPIDTLFIGGLLPGFMLVLMMAAWGIRQGVKTGAGSQPFQPKEAAAAVWGEHWRWLPSLVVHARWRSALKVLRSGADWELLLPLVVLAGVFGGFMTLVETAALTVVYALVVEVFVYRDLSIRKDLPRVVIECATLIGGVLIILGTAMGFTNYLIDAGVPAALIEWIKGHIQSPLMFLLALNVFLLVVGCLMDIYSAILVVVPLIAPLGAAYGIHPVHLGIIFLTNLELGYITPPVGMNLFLSAYRFNRPMVEIIRSTLPFLLIRVFGVLLITYVPFISLGLLAWLGR